MTEDDMPIVFNCFTSTSGNLNIVNFTCSFNDSSTKIPKGFNISFHIKVSNKAALDVSDSEASWDQDNRLLWAISELDDEKSPSLEIKTTESPVNMFPLAVNMKLGYSVLGVQAKAYDENKEEMLLAFSSCCESQNFIVSFE